MRIKRNINEDWSFSFNGENSVVKLPHTWNNIDGQDGRDGYKRGVGTYVKNLGRTEDGETYLEILGANAKAEVLINNEKVAAHSGGYSAFYVNLTGKLKNEDNVVTVKVDNSPDESVYPTMADFTFYGGLYRDVNLISFDTATHFDVTENGVGVFVTTERREDDWYAKITAKVVGATPETMVNYKILDKDGHVVKSVDAAADSKEISVAVENPVLWQGVKNPYLYTVRCVLSDGEKKTDMVEVKTGFREILIDADNGFFLNGKPIKIKGVSRHQDRENMGNAITVKEHEEDVKLIKEVGANSVRLAHYQQNQDFYDICDREGLLVWAEVPVISRFGKKRQDNAKQQLTELITQSKNHVSIFCWSICNEITIAGEAKGLYESIVELNDLAKKLDPSRYTAMAEVTMCASDSRLNSITDILGYNHYFGWYMGTFKDLDDWLNKWRETAPDKKLCLSEYGAEGIIAYQGDTPTQGDYSEGYQAVYHENYIKRINAADWLWGSYVWNMFDFGSAARNEGGVRGRNNKGLVTFDRKIKKDAFYAYKAYWSDEPFVYIAGCRYINRPIGKTTIKVYSNLPEITLNANGRVYTKTADKVFIFDDITIEEGENRITAHSGNHIVDLTINGVKKVPDSYKLPEGASSMVRNWFDGNPDEFKPDCFSIDEKVGALLKNAEVKNLLKKFAGKKADSKLLYLIYPYKVRTLLKLPFIKIDDEMIKTANRYLQTIKK